jgi:hypothetical protein
MPMPLSFTPNQGVGRAVRVEHIVDDYRSRLDLGGDLSASCVAGQTLASRP